MHKLIKKNKFKVLHLVDPSGLYGAETVILNLSNELNEHKKYIPIVGAIKKKSSFATPEIVDTASELGLETAVFPSHFRVDPLCVWKLYNYVIKNEIKIIHSHGYKTSILSFLPCRMLKIPLIITCHLWFNKRDFKLTLYHNLETQVMKTVPAVIGVSGEICKGIAAKGVRTDKIRLVYNGINLSNYREFPKESAKKLFRDLKIGVSDIVVGTAGRLHEQKAHHYLLDAMKILKEKKIPIKCIILGEGPLRSDLERQRLDLELDDFIYFPGFRDDLINILELIDIFVLTSIDEGLPMILLEAMALRKPIISTPVGAIDKVLAHGQDAILYDVGDITSLARHLMELVYDPTKRRKMGEAAYQRFEEGFTSSKMAESYTNIYNSAILPINIC